MNTLCLSVSLGGYDKCGCLWDLRRPYSPLEKQEKGITTSLSGGVSNVYVYM